jgi:hypothetical protein
VTTAFGCWHEGVPDGWVGVYAKPGAFHLPTSEGVAPFRTFLVPKEQYDGRYSTFGVFVCDENRHPSWDPSKPKSEQVLEVELEQEPEAMRP